MNWKHFLLVVSVVACSVILSCDNETKLTFPPEDVVNRITDSYFFKDGKTFMYLNSNMNRKYDFGSLVIVEIDEKSGLSYLDSLIVPSLSGKMVVNSKEDTVYVTTRDLHGVVRVKISGKQGAYRLSYPDETDGNIPKILKTKKEPYAVILNEDEDKLFVTHLLGGELTIVDLEKWELIETYKLKYGVTDIVFDSNSGFYIASHKSSGNISLIDIFESSLSGLTVGVSESELGLPTDGYDMRSLKISADGTSLYASFQNYSDDEDEDSAPQLLKFTLTGKKKTEVEILQTVPLKGSLGEIAVFPFTTGEEENEYNGELIFATSPGEKSLYIVDSGRGEMIESIIFKKCEPYQLSTLKTGKTEGLLSISCFAQDNLHLYKVDVSKKELLTDIGEIK